MACPRAVSDSGLAVGTAGRSAFRWNLENGTFTALPDLPDGEGVGTDARDVNDDGVVVGLSRKASGQSVPVRWSPDGHPTRLLDPQGVSREGLAASVNRAGTASGYSDGYVATRAPGAGTATYLTTSFAGPVGAPINDAGTVVSAFVTCAAGHLASVTSIFPPGGPEQMLHVPGWDGFAVIVWEGSDTLVGTGTPAGQTTSVPVRYSLADGTLTPLADALLGDTGVLAANAGQCVLMRVRQDDGSQRLVEVS